MQSQAKPGQRLTQIDGLRAIAALSVVLFHYTTRYDQKYSFPDLPPFELAWGGRGVQLFFVISGFVIFMSVEAARRPLDFVVSRVSRLYPTYWVALALSWCVLQWAQMPGSVRTLPELLVNLTMIQGVFGVKSVDGVYWSLQVELIFYVWMLLLASLDVLRRMDLVLLAWLMVCLAATFGGQAGLHIPYVVRYFGLLEWIPWFGLGMLSYGHLRYPGRVPGRALAAVLALLSIGFGDGWSAAVFAALACAAVSLAARNRLVIMGWRPLVAVGALSYPLYLIHEQIGWIVIHHTQELGWPGLASVATAVALSLGLAHGLHRRVEESAARLLRRHYGRAGDSASRTAPAGARGMGVPDRRWAGACAAVLVTLVGASTVSARRDRPETVVAATGLPAAGSGVASGAGRAGCVELASRHPIVLLALGDVNATSGLEDLRSRAPVHIFAGSTCTVVSDPMPTASGRAGSPWSALVPALELQTAGVPIVIVPLAAEGLTITQWTDAGPHRARFLALLGALKASGLLPTAVLWQHGEADSLQGVEARDYVDGVRRLRQDLFNAGIAAPMLLAQSTYCHSAGSGAIARAYGRLEKAGLPQGMTLGPVIDDLTGSYREDGCRLSASGRDLASARWAQQLLPIVAGQRPL